MGFAGRHVGLCAGVPRCFCCLCRKEEGLVLCTSSAWRAHVACMYHACTVHISSTPTSLLPVHECTRTCNTCLAACLPPCLTGCLPLLPPSPPPSPSPPFLPASQPANQPTSQPAGMPLTPNRIASYKVDYPLPVPPPPPNPLNRACQGGERAYCRSFGGAHASSVGPTLPMTQ